MNTTTAAHIDRNDRNVEIDIGKSSLDVCILELDAYLQFAKAQGIIAKTDKLDSRLIAQFGAILKPEVRPLNSKNTLYQGFARTQTPIKRHALARTQSPTQNLSRTKREPQRVIKLLD